MPNCEKPESPKMTHPTVQCTYMGLRKPSIYSSYAYINQEVPGPKNVITEF